MEAKAVSPEHQQLRSKTAIVTGAGRGLGRAIHDHFLHYWKSGAMRNPDKVASLAVFLASSSSDSITGHYGGLQEYTLAGWN